MQWPYNVRLNPFGVLLLFVVFLSLYLIYTSNSKTTTLIKKFEDQHYARLKFMHTPIAESQDIIAGSLNARHSPVNDQILKNELMLFQMVNLKQLLAAAIQVAQNGGEQVRQVREKKNMTQKDKGFQDPLTEGDMRSHQVMVGQLNSAWPSLKVISEENESSLNGVKDIQYEKLNKEKIPSYLSLLPDLSVALTELSVWIDPLDATQEYTEGLFQYVTTMVCVAYKGKPIIGVIHKPFERSSNQKHKNWDNPEYETYWAWKDVGHSSNLNEYTNQTKKRNNNRPLKIIVSRSHPGKIKEKAKEVFGNQKIEMIEAGGAGYKIIELVKGNVDMYIHNTLIKKWDICAPNAIVDELNKKRQISFTNLKGEAIDYSFKSGPLNKNGVLATTKINYKNLIDKFTI